MRNNSSKTANATAHTSTKRCERGFVRRDFAGRVIRRVKAKQSHSTAMYAAHSV
jgi:hypothetical protein